MLTNCKNASEGKEKAQLTGRAWINPTSGQKSLGRPFCLVFNIISVEKALALRSALTHPSTIHPILLFLVPTLLGISLISMDWILILIKRKLTRLI